MASPTSIREWSQATYTETGVQSTKKLVKRLDLEKGLVSTKKRVKVGRYFQ